MNKRIGLVCVAIKDRQHAAKKVNEILSQYGEIVVGRIGVPYKDRGVSIIGLIIEASTDQLGSMTGKLGMLENVQVKSLMLELE